MKLLESRGSIGRGNDSLDMSGSAGYFVIGKGLYKLYNITAISPILYRAYRLVDCTVV